jgi:hypothetical protein
MPITPEQLLLVIAVACAAMISSHQPISPRMELPGLALYLDHFSASLACTEGGVLSSCGVPVINP